MNLGKKFSDFKFVYTFYNSHEKSNWALLVYKAAQMSRKTENIEYAQSHLEGSAHLPHPPTPNYYLFCEASTGQILWGHDVRYRKYKYKYANLVPLQLAPFGVRLKSHVKIL